MIHCVYKFSIHNDVSAIHSSSTQLKISMKGMLASCISDPLITTVYRIWRVFNDILQISVNIKGTFLKEYFIEFMY